MSKSRARRQAAADLYAGIVGRAREPVFYTDFAVPDTIDGRFDLLALHAWLVLERLSAANLNDLSQDLTNTIFVGFDEGLRDLGTGDMGMGRRIKTLANAFYGRLSAYRAATDAAAMESAVARNLYRGAQAGHEARIARYAKNARAHLEAQDLSQGRIDFGSLP
ncbi:MAG: ubiquinol-cytochrome C chaperone [Alphaproteobacteria bacterium]|nr:ubiquinol-cytochrome C chaperone [Alphaproteobacteria bacterium]